MTRAARAFLVMAATLMALSWSSPTRACTACACGSSASLPAGAEIPWGGRLRTGVVLTTSGTHTSDKLGRADAMGATLSGLLLWAPSSDLMLDVAVPLGARVLLHDGVGEGVGVGMGDVDVGGRVFARDRAFAPTWLGGLRVGARLPTTTWLRRDDGSSRARAVQPGLGELGLSAQLQGVYAPNRTLAFVGIVDGQLPLLSLYDDVTSGALVEARAFALLRANGLVSVRGGLGARGNADARRDDDVERAKASSEARAVAFVEAGVVADLSTELQLAVTAQVPTLGLGEVGESPRLSAALLFDW